MISTRRLCRMLAVCVSLGLLAAGMMGCQDKAKEAAAHPTFTTPPRQPQGPVATGSATTTTVAQPTNTHF